VPKLVQYTLPDPYLNCTAWTFVAPDDWTKEGGVSWTGGLSPAYSTALSVSKPKSLQEFRLFPIFIFADTPIPIMANGAEIRRYSDAKACIRDILIPRCRKEAGQVRITASENLPALSEEAISRARALNLTAPRASAARMLVEYAIGDQQVEEMFYCIVVSAKSPGIVTWAIDRAFSYRAEKGKLKHEMPLFGSIAASLQESDQWVSARRRELQRIVNSRTRPPVLSSGSRGPSILDVSRQMSRDNDQFLKGVDQSFSARLNSPGLAAWHEAQTGSSAMTNPTTGENVSVSNGYLRYFQDNLGRVYGTNDVIGDPYVNYGINATELESSKK
jgi:hypothetical protein